MSATHWFDGAGHHFCLFQRGGPSSPWTCTAMKVGGKRKRTWLSGGLRCDGTQDSNPLGALVRLCDRLGIDQGAAVAAVPRDKGLGV